VSAARTTVPARRLGWIALAAVVVVALGIGLTDRSGSGTPGERAHGLAESIQCPTCDGQSVADSDATASRFIRDQIDQRIAEGASDDRIRDELADSYGDGILLTPERSGLIGLVWVLPVAALVVALVGIAFAFRRWRGRSVVAASDADRALVERALDDLHAAP
jgi:cytochrome c-type biogenesis protein CcmH